jgi:hypothetical protein
MRNLERYSRNIRNENRATITTHKNAPRKNEGVDGDIRITTTTTEGIKLFAKYNGEWYSSSLEKEVLKEKRVGDVSTIIISDGVKVNCKMKIFTGTTAATGDTETIVHGIESGKKRIVAVNTMVQSDGNASGDSPADSFLSPGGIYQDEGHEDYEFTTYHDDTNIYIYTENSGDDVANNRYICTIWYSKTDVY